MSEICFPDWHVIDEHIKEHGKEELNPLLLFVHENEPCEGNKDYLWREALQHVIDFVIEEARS